MERPTDKIIGWGADAPLANRPGVPQELDPPTPLGFMSLIPPAQQIGHPAVQSKFRKTTATYGTTVQLRGLSGLVRRMAYAAPDYKPRRWVLLLLADRIDVIEHNVVPAATFALTLGAVGAAGYYGIRALRRR